jgi:4-diphosphocytidyl-2-C-methyl-D-erythritol kinase
MVETALAFAKINISLDVVSRMTDGYHSMKMVMQSIDLSDEIEIECVPGSGVSVEAGLPYLPDDERNIAAKAAYEFLKFTGIEGYSVAIHIKKEIPVCAGLGGGSTDGACVLRMLNSMLGAKLGRASLEKLGRSVGSDVPFCIDGGTSLAEGSGDVLTDLAPLPGCHIVICKPAFSCSTPELFGRIQCDRIRSRPDTEGIIKALDNGDLSNVARGMYNVFEDVLPQGTREIADIKYALLDNGALGATMTGTGPAVFGIFDKAAYAKAAFEHLRSSYKECFLAEDAGRIGVK